MSSQLINQVLELTNAERAKAALKPLTRNNRLTQAAQGHSDSMAADDFFSHTGADGSSVSDRVIEEGYDFARAGENIAAGQTIAEQVIESWMNSPGHRANILNAEYTEIGVGYELLQNDTGSVNYNHYWTQVFGKSLNDNSQVSNDVPNPPVEQNNSINPVANKDPLINNLDINLFGMEMGDTNAEFEDVNEDFTGASSNQTLTGGDDIMTSPSTESVSYREQFSSSDYNYIEDISHMSNKSWLGTSEFDLSNYQSEEISNLFDSSFSWDRQQQIAKS